MSKKLLKAEHFNRIDHESNWSTYQDQNRDLLKIILPSVQNNLKCPKFIDALKATGQTHVANHILRLGGGEVNPSLFGQ